MRVSTAQFYLQSALQMSNKSSDVNEQMAHLSSGKRVMSAKDDAVQFGTLSGYKEELANLDKYKRNITMAENHNSLQEVILADAGNILENIKQDLLLANNGRMSTEDLTVIANQLSNGFDQLLDLSNSQDEKGEYIFSGYQTDKQSFSQQVDGNVTYSGDTGVNALQVAKNINVKTNQTGDDVFLKVANPVGDFTADYTTNTSGVALATANVIDRNQYNSSAMPHDYTFDFDALNGDLTITDSTGGIVFPPAPYVAGQTVSFDGIEVTLSGNPLPGDNFTMKEEENISVFSTLKDAINWVSQGVVSTDQEQYQVDYNTILDQLNTAMTHVSSKRGESGIRLQLLESQKNRHLDAELHLTTGKADIEDLDFAKAISEFEQSKISLQASQQAFTKVQNLSLFNYI